MPSRDCDVTGTCDGPPLRIVVVGHVDHGKSTLIGRLFYDAGQLPDGKYEQLAAAAARRGARFEFANLTDALQAERDQNITIDVSHIWFRSNGRRFAIIDAPGHREFLKNTVTGAARADAAVVVIDGHEGVQEQSRRHGLLLTLLGVPHVGVVVNKLDLVAFSRERFERVADEYAAFLCSIGITPTAIVPAAARDGDNVVAKSPALEWYTGPTVLELLEAFQPTPRLDSSPLRFPVQDVYRVDDRRIVAGRIEAGHVRVGDVVQFLPGGRHSRVKTIERWSAPPSDSATAGESIGMTLTDQIFVERGDVACSLADTPHVETDLHARIFWLGKRPLVAGRPYVMRLTTQETDCEVMSIERIIDASTLAARDRTGGVTGNDIADVRIRTARPLVFDVYQHVATLGRFVLVDDLDVAGGGTIARPSTSDIAALRPVAAHLTRSVTQVTRAERYARHRHAGGVVWFTGLSGSGKSTIANMIERTLFDRRMHAFVLDGDNIRHGLSADLGFSASDRAENIRRVAEAAKLFAEAGLIAITAFISPYRTDRLLARRIVEETDIAFCEVFLDVPLDVCEGRDPKRLYEQARSGGIANFTGISAPYEPPDMPDVVLRTHETTVEESVATVLDYLLPRIGHTAPLNDVFV
jgi:bifunctional enzyme CysN/CysC